MSSSNPPPQEAQPLVAPLTIGDANCAAVIGRSWRWCLETARALGVPVLTVRRRPVIPAQQFIEALWRAGVDPSAAANDAKPPAPIETGEDVLARLGLEVRG